MCTFTSMQDLHIDTVTMANALVEKGLGTALTPFAVEVPNELRTKALDYVWELQRGARLDADFSPQPTPTSTVFIFFKP